MGQPATSIPAFGLYGETGLFPDLMHCERIVDRAARHDWVIDPHRHANLYQFFLIGGTGAAFVLDGVETNVTEPVCLSVPPFVVHAFRFPRGQEGFVLSVPPEVLPDLLGSAPSRPAAFAAPLVAPASAAMGTRFETIRDELDDTRPMRDAVLCAQVTELAVELLRACDGGADRGPPGPAERHMRDFERLVRRHLRDHLRSSDYAEALGLSADHLSRICRAVTGLTAASFVEARLMQEARRQLAYTRNTVAQIAYDLGYADPSYFSRTFRRVHGNSPLAYRADRAGRAT